ncbi:MAG: peptide deformylase [Yoonia sp.]|nr:peptide deformylase [Yoonia sp.]
MELRLLPDPVLREVCAPVTAFDAALEDVVAEMLAVMYAAPGRGLAAPQVGLTQRIFVMDTTWKTGDPSPMVFVNPEIVSVSAEMAVHDEGCLSIPDCKSRLARPARVDLRWQDLDGELQVGSFEGFAAACVQHERDHLDGVLCIDYPEAT